MDISTRVSTRIPEGRKVDGLDYGAIETAPEGSRYWVRPSGWTEWVSAALTPSIDELAGDGTDEDIVDALVEELTADYSDRLARRWRDGAADAGDLAMVAVCDRALSGDVEAQAEVARCQRDADARNEE